MPKENILNGTSRQFIKYNSKIINKASGVKNPRTLLQSKWTHSRHFSNNWIRSGHLSKHTTDTYLDTHQTHLWFAPFAQQHPLKFSSTSMSLVIFHTSLHRQRLVVLLGWFRICGPSVCYFMLLFFSLTFLSSRVSDTPFVCLDIYIYVCVCVCMYLSCPMF